MDFNEYVRGIRFRALQPDDPLTEENLESLRRVAGSRPLDYANTELPIPDENLQLNLLDLCRRPRMSTFANGAIIHRAVSEMEQGTSFVNVGVWHGFTLFSGMSGNPDMPCVGIDNFSEFTDGPFINPRQPFYDRFKAEENALHRFHEMDYRDYFAKIHQGPIGFYIYDGEHDYDNQLHGLQIAEPFFSNHCLILVDDTNWEEPRKGTLDFVAQSRNRYEMLFDLKTACNGHPTFWNGIMIFRRIG